MSQDTKQQIIEQCKKNFALYGSEGVSIRTLAKDLGIAQSVLYYYFPSKEKMLEEVFEYTRKDIGKKRAKLPKVKDAKELLDQRIKFQFENALDVIYILKYYAHFRSKFKKNPQGYVPVAAYKHIKEVLDAGVKQKKFLNKDVDTQAKIITHAVNGFILEYYPKIPRGNEKEILISDISEFIYRGIKKGGVENGR